MKQYYPLISMGLGLVLALVLFRFGPGNEPDGASMPLLTALFVSEFGFLLTIGAVVVCALEIRRQGSELRRVSQLLGNLILAVLFLYFGLDTWSFMAIPA